MWNVLHRIPVANDMVNCLFQWKKSDHDVKLMLLKQEVKRQ